MSQPAPSPVPYGVYPSGRVSGELRALIQRATAAGRGPAALDALKRLYHILRIYPQHGEPLRDLNQIGETLRTLVVPPLVVRYVLDEPQRAVFIGDPIKAMKNAGFQ